MKKEMKLSRKIKLELYNLIIKTPNSLGDFGDEGVIPFLNNIWDLSSMKSEDKRYNSALGDFTQHLVNNPNDYSYDYVFKERLKLLDDDEKFTLFIETILLPKFREGEDDIFKFVLLISPYLEKEGYTLILKDYDTDGFPLYKIDIVPKANVPTDIKPNDIIFYVERKPRGRNDSIRSHQPPPTYPSFVLVFNPGWNDYMVMSSFHLYYYNNPKEPPIDIGANKIIYKDEKETINFLLDSFVSLSESFCSLGQNFYYYEKLKEALGKNFNSVLYALRDAAFFSEIQDEFDDDFNFKNSLIRSDDTERLLRECPYKIYGYDLNNLYSFKYTFNPAYADLDNGVDIEFDFNATPPLPNRIYAIIGKNGAGKTQLITSLPEMISRKKEELFIPRTPLFSKIIAVSYSAFDRFSIPKKTSTFNYCYCGIRKENNDQYTEKELVIRFNESCRKIESLGRINKWRKILLTFVNKDIIDLFLKDRDDDHIASRNSYKVDMMLFADVKNKLSSGQAIIIYIITEIVANIRYDSLLLYDEPETHLHPNAITQLMNTVYELVEEFQSYCIIATHSPLVVRELFSKNVYVLNREDNFPSVRRISLESFGENLSVLTEEIFGNKGIPKQHKKILNNLVDSGKSYEEIVSMLEIDEIPLSLNARIYIKSIINKKDNSLL